MARQGNSIDYCAQNTGLRNCWITTWQEWCRGAEVVRVAE